MSTATLERASAPETAAWGPWIVGSNGVGQRNCFVLRYQDASDHRSPAEYHVNGKGDSIKYTMAGAEKKAHELNRADSNAQRLAAYHEKQEQKRIAAEIAAAQQRELVQLVARDVRSAAQCGTANSEAIAAWILENFVERIVHDDVIAEHRQTLAETAAERNDHRAELIEGLNTAIDHAKAAAEVLDIVGGTMQRLDEHDPLAFAYGATDLDKMRDVLQPAMDAMELHDRADWNYGPLPEKREVA